MWQDAKTTTPRPMRDVKVELIDGSILDGCTYRPNNWRDEKGALIEREKIAFWRNYTANEALERTTVLCAQIEYDAKNSEFYGEFANQAGYDPNVDPTRRNANE